MSKSQINQDLNVIEFYPGGDFKVKKLSEDNKLINLFQSNLFLYQFLQSVVD